MKLSHQQTTAITSLKQGWGAFMRTTVAVAVACLIFGGISVAQDARATSKRSTNIPAQGLGAALQALATDRNLQLVYASTEVDNLRTAGAAGDLTIDEALTKLLAGTGLTYTFLDDDTITVLPPGASSRASGDASSGKESSNSSKSVPLTGPENRRSFWERFRLAQAEGTENSQDMQKGEGQSPEAASQDRGARSDERARMPEILIKGSRSLNMDIERTENDTQPYVVFDREDLERSRESSLEDFFRKQLPMHTALGANNLGPGTPQGNRSSINLRGLGVSQTLILVDGRRMASGFFGGSIAQPDINAIPLHAIERVEVLASGAGGIYGGGATGGVINIITRKDRVGLDILARYGDSFQSDAANRNISFNGGFLVEGGRTHVSFSGSYADSDPLTTGARDFSERARALQLANNPSAFYSTATPPSGYTSNIRNQSGANLRLKPEFGGTQLNSPVTHIPVGYAGPLSDGGAALVTNSGSYNLDISDDLLGRRFGLLSGTRVASATALVRRDFSESLTGYVDAGWYSNRSVAPFASVSPNTVTLPAGAPNNPFTTAINVTFPAVGLNYDADSESETLRAATGAILRLPRSWALGVDYEWSRARTLATQTAPSIGDPDGSGPLPSVATALSNGTLDVMRDLNLYPLEYGPYLLHSPNSVIGPADDTLQRISLKASGPVGHLPAGRPSLTALVERREEEISNNFQDQMTTSGVASSVFFSQREQIVQSYYLELQAPLFAKDNELPLLRALDFQASVRHDRYETTAPTPASVALPSRSAATPATVNSTNRVDATKYTLGLRYAPFRDLAFRSSFATGFFPATVQNVAPNVPRFPATAPLADPKRGNTSVTVGPFTLLSGGNPFLRAEESESFSVGAIYTPARVSDLRLSLDYTRIEKRDEISGIQLQTLLDLEDLLPGRVERAPLTPSDVALGYTGGAITLLDQTSINLAESRIAAYDLSMEYAWRAERFGRVDFYIATTYQPTQESRTLPTAPLLNSIGFRGSTLRWRGNAGATWHVGTWDIGWAMQYFDSSYIYGVINTPAQRDAAVLSQGSLYLPSQTYHDLLIRYVTREGTSLLANSEISLGVQNAFNEIPAINAGTSGLSGYSTFGDPRLRRYSITVQKRF